LFFIDDDVLFTDFFKNLGHQSLFVVGAPEANDSLNAAMAMNSEIVSRLVPSYNTQTLFFMTWGHRDGDSYNPDLNPDFKTMNEHLLHGYSVFQTVTRASDGSRETYIAPVGLVFEDIFDNLSTLYSDTPALFTNLYNEDGFHPSSVGTHTAALTILCTITGRSPLRPFGLITAPAATASEAFNVRRAVHRVLFETKLFANETIKFPFPYAYNSLSSYPPYAAAGADWDGIISGYVPVPTVQYDGNSNEGGVPEQSIVSLTLGAAQDEGGRLYVRSGTLTADNGCTVGSAGDGVLRVLEGATMVCTSLLLGGTDTATSEIQMVGGTLRSSRVYAGSPNATIILDFRNGTLEVEVWELDLAVTGIVYVPSGINKTVSGSLDLGSGSTMNLALNGAGEKLLVGAEAAIRGTVVVTVSYDFPPETSQPILEAQTVTLDSAAVVNVPDGFRVDVQSIENGRQALVLTNGESLLRPGDASLLFR
jgi:hypothetical protein